MGRLGNIRKAIRERRLGFLINETMVGEHEFEPGFGDAGRRPMEFSVTWGAADLLKWLSPASDAFMTSPFEGTVTIDGLCRDAPCRGTLTLRYFSTHTIRYAFTFEAAGKRYRYVGEKMNIRWWNLPVSHTTCFGRLTEEVTNALVSTSLTHFRLRSAPAFLASLRLA